jgi:hypothetical protein
LRDRPQDSGANRGVNFIRSQNTGLDSESARDSLDKLKKLGVNTVAFVPFMWQPNPAKPEITMGDAVEDAELQAGIEYARRLGLKVFLKPHVWVPQTWAGEIRMANPADWRLWFENYTRLIRHYAQLAEAHRVEFFSIGVELEQTVQEQDWKALIASVREVYSGKVTFVANGEAGVTRVSFWDQMDFIALSLYPELGESAEAPALRARIHSAAQTLWRTLERAGKPVWIAEVGIRSAKGAQVKPWESPEERQADPDLVLQATVLDLWLQELNDPRVAGILVWRWYSDPLAGGSSDTDFTPQNKPAEGVLLSHWRRYVP